MNTLYSLLLSEGPILESVEAPFRFADFYYLLEKDIKGIKGAISNPSEPIHTKNEPWKGSNVLLRRGKTIPLHPPASVDPLLSCCSREP